MSEAKFLNEMKHDASKQSMITNLDFNNTYLKKSNSIFGDLAENYAINYFLQQGCLVAKNTSQHGLFDIVVLDNNKKLTMYDVKKMTFRSETCKNFPHMRTWNINSKPPTHKQKECGVKILYVDIENLNVWIPEDDTRGYQNKSMEELMLESFLIPNLDYIGKAR